MCGMFLGGVEGVGCLQFGGFFLALTTPCLCFVWARAKLALISYVVLKKHDFQVIFISVIVHFIQIGLCGESAARIGGFEGFRSLTFAYVYSFKLIINMERHIAFTE